MISHDHRIIFVHIQKTGGNSVTTLFNMPISEPGKHWRAVNLRGRYGPLVWDQYWKFSIVRNPWDRLVSWWAMIDAKRSEFDRGNRPNVFQSYILRNAKSFDDFVKLCSGDVLNTDGPTSMSRNQVDYLFDHTGVLLVDKIFRFETLQEDMPIELNQRGLPSKLPNVNASIRGHYKEYYTRELQDIVAEMYRKDIEAFNYRFNEN